MRLALLFKTLAFTIAATWLVAIESAALAGQVRWDEAGRVAQCAVDAPDAYGSVPVDEAAADEGDDEDDADAGAAQAGAGGFALGGQRCVFPTLSVAVGGQSTRTLGERRAPSAGLLQSKAWQSQLSTTFGLSVVDGSYETPLVTTLSMNASGTGDLTISEASISNRSLAFGLLGSRFDGWSGDEFTLRSLAPSQSPGVASVVLARGANSVTLISLEDPSFRRVGVSGYGGLVIPDVIGRWAGRMGAYTLMVSAATHETRFDDGGIMRGYAGLASLKYEIDAVGEGSYVLLQAGAADKAPGYLGVHTTSNVYGFSLQGAFSAQSAEKSRGVSGAAVGVWEVNPHWRLAAYATGVKLKLPSSGDLTISRTAANIQWTPVKPLAFALEAGYVTARSPAPNLPTVRAFSVVIALTRSL